MKTRSLITSRALELSVLGLLTLSHGSWSSDETSRERPRPSKVASTNAAPQNSSALVNSNKQATASSNTRTNSTSSERRITGTGSEDLNYTKRFVRTGAQDFSYTFLMNPAAFELLSTLQTRLSADKAPPIRFSGKSTDGHEFVVTIRPAATDLLNEIIFSTQYPIDVEFDFDGAQGAPIRGQLQTQFISDEQNLYFSGPINLGSEFFPELDVKSDISLKIVYNPTIDKFELRHFSLKMGQLSAVRFRGNPIEETIVFGGLDSGGGKK